MAHIDDTAGGADSFETRFARLGAELGAAGQRVARWIAQNPAAALASSATALAAEAETSDATVIRTVQTLGYAGLAELKRAIAAALDRGESAATPADNMRLTLAELEGVSLKAIDTVLDTHDAALAVLRSDAFRHQLGRALPILHEAERIVVFGIGPTAALAHYAAVLVGRAGRNARCMDVSGMMLADQLLDLRKGDAVVAMVYGRPYREGLGLLAHAGDLAVPFVLISDKAEGPIATRADAVMVVPRGRNGHIAMHAGTMLALEIIVLALAASDQNRALERLERLNMLRAAVLGQPRDV